MPIPGLRESIRKGKQIIGVCRADGKQYLPPGGRCPEGADEEWRNLKFSAAVGITVQHLDEFRKIGTIR